MIVTRATLKSSFPEIIATSEEKAALAVKMACERIEMRAKGKSRVDTGNMRAGWEHEMTGPTEGIVFNLVEYAIYNEYGTMSMPAQPMLVPAVEETRHEFEEDLALAFQPRVVSL